MMLGLALYAIGAAVVFGWLLRAHVTARHPIDSVPLYIFVLFPLLWLPTVLIAALFVLLMMLRWAVALTWTQRGGW